MQKRRRESCALLLFIALAYGMVWLLYGIWEYFDIPFSMDPRQPGGRFYLLGAAIPSIAALVTVFVTGGQEGLRLLLQRSFRWRFHPGWYAAAVLTPPVVTLGAAIAAVYCLGAHMPAQWFSPVFGAGFLLFFLIHDGLGEEIGWRGFALPFLQERLGSLGGNIAVGFIWALWHFPLFLMPGSFQYGDSILLYVWLLTCWSVVMGLFVHRAGGSVLVAILFHETANFIAFTVHYPGSGYFFLLWGVAAAVAIVFLPRPLFRLPGKSDDAMNTMSSHRY